MNKFNNVLNKVSMVKSIVIMSFTNRILDGNYYDPFCDMCSHHNDV